MELIELPPAAIAHALRLLSSAGPIGPRATEQPNAVAAHVVLSGPWPLYSRELDAPPVRDAGEAIDEARAVLAAYLAGTDIPPAVVLCVADALAALDAPVFPTLDE